jgi:6-phosphogluconolactonase
VTGSTRPHIRVFHDPETLSRAAAEFFVSLSKKTIALQGRFIVALSGGSTPRRLYALLGSLPFCENVDWNQVHLFWVDERCVPADHQESNFKHAVDAFIAKAAIPAANIHRIRGEEGPDQAAQKYEQDIRSFFGPTALPVFDLIILGVGEDGHTASLFPGTAALREKTRLAAPVYLDPQKLSRVTLTLLALNHAIQVLFLASGRTKSEVVHEIVENENRKQYPAGLVHPVRGSIDWFIDNEAAALLTDQTKKRS